MTIEQLKALPVADLAAPDCVLFMWRVGPMPAEALDVIRAWGFTLKNFKGFTWIKLNKKNLQPFMGMGNWTRANSEDCLIAVRGKPKRVNAGVRQVVMSPIGAHSAKPDVVRARIETLMGDIPRIELFARKTAPGWDSWGNEVGKLDEVLE